MLFAVLQNSFFYMIVEYLTSYIQLICDWLFLREIISFFICEMVNILYLDHWMILHTVRSICFFVFQCNYLCWYGIGCFYKKWFFLRLWYDYFFFLSSLSESLLPLIYMLSLFIWILVVGMLSVFWPEKLFRKTVRSLVSYIVFIDWFIVYFVIYFYLFLNIAVHMLLAVLQAVIALYHFEMILILYPVYWLILYLLWSAHSFIFKLL